MSHIIYHAKPTGYAAFLAIVFCIFFGMTDHTKKIRTVITVIINVLLWIVVGLFIVTLHFYG